MDKITIRSAHADDMEAIGQLWAQLVAFHRTLSPDLPKAAENGAELYARRLADRLHDTHTYIVVAEAANKLVGYTFGVIVDLVPEMFLEERAGFLADIFVDSDYRKRGVGRALYEALVAWFAERDITYIEWYVAATNTDARAFWQELGGRTVMMRMRVNIDDQDKGTG